MSQDLFLKLDELFCELELHEQANLSPKEKGIILMAVKKENKKMQEESASPLELEQENTSIAST